MSAYLENRTVDNFARTPEPMIESAVGLQVLYHRILCETSDAWIRARDCYVQELNEKEQQMYFRASPESLLDRVFVRRLENPAKHKTLAFDFRPWGSNGHFGPYGCVGCQTPSVENVSAKDLPHISMIYYAAKMSNLLLLTSS